MTRPRERFVDDFPSFPRVGGNGNASKGEYLIRNKVPRTWSARYALFMPYWMAITPDGSTGSMSFLNGRAGTKGGRIISVGRCRMAVSASGQGLLRRSMNGHRRNDGHRALASVLVSKAHAWMFRIDAEPLCARILVFCGWSKRSGLSLADQGL